MQANWRAVVVVAALIGFTPAAAQGPELNAVMREKLEHAQKLLEAVVTSDWTGLETHSRELQRITDDHRWTVLKYPEYARYGNQFRRAIGDLHTAAAQRDLDKTSKAYVAVTLSCVECHRYLARERIVRGGSHD